MHSRRADVESAGRSQRARRRSRSPDGRWHSPRRRARSRSIDRMRRNDRGRHSARELYRERNSRHETAHRQLPALSPNARSAARSRERSASPSQQTFWQKRQRRRDRVSLSPIWRHSPSPPRTLEERFQVGADERKRKERRRKRKEERRARREAKRVKSLAQKPPPSSSASLPVGAATGAQALTTEKESERGAEEDDENDLGPNLPVSLELGGKDYGKALRPGEGSAMAAFVQDGVRIPRRGEIGLDGKQIEDYETQGYVMSGSRHRRMEAVRMRKENQVYSAEERAALSQFSHEERRLREQQMLNQFRVLVESKLGGGSVDQDEKQGPGK